MPYMPGIRDKIIHVIFLFRLMSSMLCVTATMLIAHVGLWSRLVLTFFSFTNVQFTEVVEEFQDHCKNLEEAVMKKSI